MTLCRAAKSPSYFVRVAGVGGGAACASKGTWCVTSGGRCGGILGPSSGLSYAVGTGRPHF